MIRHDRTEVSIEIVVVVYNIARNIKPLAGHISMGLIFFFLSLKETRLLDNYV